MQGGKKQSIVSKSKFRVNSVLFEDQNRALEIGWNSLNLRISENTYSALKVEAAKPSCIKSQICKR